MSRFHDLLYDATEGCEYENEDEFFDLIVHIVEEKYPKFLEFCDYNEFDIYTEYEEYGLQCSFNSSEYLEEKFLELYPEELI